METTKIAFVGVGDISGIYLKTSQNCSKNSRSWAYVTLVREKAERAAEKYNIPKIYDTMYDAFCHTILRLTLS